jgi:hypothetical protein
MRRATGTVLTIQDLAGFLQIPKSTLSRLARPVCRAQHAQPRSNLAVESPTVTSTLEQLSAGALVRGPMLPEPAEVITVIPMGDSVKLVAKGVRTGHVHTPVLSAVQLSSGSGIPPRLESGAPGDESYRMSGRPYPALLGKRISTARARLTQTLLGRGLDG